LPLENKQEATPIAMNDPFEDSADEPQASEPASLREVAFLFLRLGMTAMGGPAVHVAMMEDEFVRRRRWITREKFLDLLGTVNLIPGPISTEMAIYIGYLRAGWKGLLIAGTCFILPAMLMVTAIAVAYVRFGSLPLFTGLLYWVKPVVIAIVLQAICGLGRKAVKTWFLAAIAIAVVVARSIGIGPLTLLLVAGIIAGLEYGLVHAPVFQLRSIAMMFVVAAGILAFSYTAVRVGDAKSGVFGLWPLFLYFLKIGSVLYGGGYVLLAFLQTDLVHRWHWLTSAQLLDLNQANLAGWFAK
jgi:chromate transporter